MKGSLNYHAQTFSDELPVLFGRYADVLTGVEARTGGDRCAGSALMLISFAVVHLSFHVSIYFSASSLLII